MTKAAAYVRLSQQSDTSIQNQKEHIRQYSQEQGFQLTKIYSDGKGASGFKPDELTEYQKLVDRVKNGELNAVVVNDKRRLPRDEDALMRAVADLRSNDTELHTWQSGRIELGDSVMASIEIVRAAASAAEKRKEIERAKEVIQQRVEDPEVDHGAPRFGMTYSDDGRKQVPGEEFDTVMEILKLRRDGYSYPEIRDELDVAMSTAQRVVKRSEWYIERTKLDEESVA